MNPHHMLFASLLEYRNVISLAGFTFVNHPKGKESSASSIVLVNLVSGLRVIDIT